MDAITRSAKALTDLEATFPHVIQGLENGCFKATQYFEMEKTVPFDSGVWSTLARLHAREHYNTCRLEATDLNVQVERVSLCGLRLKVGRYHLKIWKISPDDVAKALKRLDSAERQMVLTDTDGIPIVFELAIFWTADEHHDLGKLYLVQQEIDDPRCFDWVWCREIAQAASVNAIEGGDIPVEGVGETKQAEE
jgi:hypothetical protein